MAIRRNLGGHMWSRDRTEINPCGIVILALQFKFLFNFPEFLSMQCTKYEHLPLVQLILIRGYQFNQGHPTKLAQMRMTCGRSVRWQMIFCPQQQHYCGGLIEQIENRANGHDSDKGVHWGRKKWHLQLVFPSSRKERRVKKKPHHGMCVCKDVRGRAKNQSEGKFFDMSNCRLIFSYKNFYIFIMKWRKKMYKLMFVCLFLTIRRFVRSIMAQKGVQNTKKSRPIESAIWHNVFVGEASSHLQWSTKSIGEVRAQETSP